MIELTRVGAGMLVAAVGLVALGIVQSEEWGWAALILRVGTVPPTSPSGCPAPSSPASA